MLIDTHAHLDDEQFDHDRPEVLDRARAQGVGIVINAAYDLDSSLRAVELAQKHDWIYATCGVHPHDAGKVSADYIDRLSVLAARPRVVAIGEIGLDYYRNLSPREDQIRVFREQLALARELEMPFVIHDRDAHGDLLDILRADGVGRAKGVMHCFSGSWEMALTCLKMGLYISLAGPVTFTNSRRLAEIAVNVPMDRILVETDSPYLAPVPHRGKRNEPAFVRLVAEKVAALRGLTWQEVAMCSAENAGHAFRLNKMAVSEERNVF